MPLRTITSTGDAPLNMGLVFGSSHPLVRQFRAEQDIQRLEDSHKVGDAREFVLAKRRLAGRFNSWNFPLEIPPSNAMACSFLSFQSSIIFRNAAMAAGLETGTLGRHTQVWRLAKIESKVRNNGASAHFVVLQFRSILTTELDACQETKVSGNARFPNLLKMEGPQTIREWPARTARRDRFPPIAHSSVAAPVTLSTVALPMMRGRMIFRVRALRRGGTRCANAARCQAATRDRCARNEWVSLGETKGSRAFNSAGVMPSSRRKVCSSSSASIWRR